MGGAWGLTVPAPSEGGFDPLPETRDKRENKEMKALRRKDTRTDKGQQMERDHRDVKETDE